MGAARSEAWDSRWNRGIEERRDLRQAAVFLDGQQHHASAAVVDGDNGSSCLVHHPELGSIPRADTLLSNVNFPVFRSMANALTLPTLLP